MSHKPVASLVPGQPTEDGNRVPLTRLVPGRGQRGTEAFRAMDPFLLMDHFSPMVLSPGTDAGFPPHPTAASRPSPTSSKVLSAIETAPADPVSCGPRELSS